MIYDYSIKDINGKEIPMAHYKGKVLLIVNIASKCGFTPQLEDLQKIYEKYNEKGLEIIGFPCNQFLEQAPESNSELNDFCKFNYGVTFQLSEKVEVLGKNAHPIYSYLTHECPFKGFNMKSVSSKLIRSVIEDKYPENMVGDSIKWNFTKFLIDSKGNVVERFEPSVDPIDMVPYIEKLL